MMPMPTTAWVSFQSGTPIRKRPFPNIKRRSPLTPTTFRRAWRSRWWKAAKAGLIGLTRAIASEVASRNITVNAVAPGFVVSPMTDPLPQQLKDALVARIPLGRMAQDAEIASAIVFLASDEAGYITGHVLDVNGGMRMG